jgi:hypothetical protein
MSYLARIQMAADYELQPQADHHVASGMPDGPGVALMMSIIQV